jgi:uncharacterized membrane protein
VLAALVGLVALPGGLVVIEALAWMAGAPLLAAVERALGPVCHHDPARTLGVAGSLLPVCARCSGLYLGLVVGPAVGWWLPWRGRPLVWAVGLSALSVVLGLGAAVAEAVGWVSTSNEVRVVLGLCLSVGPVALGVVGARLVAHELGRVGA